MGKETLRGVTRCLASSGRLFTVSLPHSPNCSLAPSGLCPVLHHQRPCHLLAVDWSLPACKSAVPTLCQAPVVLLWTHRSSASYSDFLRETKQDPSPGERGKQIILNSFRWCPILAKSRFQCLQWWKVSTSQTLCGTGIKGSNVQSDCKVWEAVQCPTGTHVPWGSICSSLRIKLKRLFFSFNFCVLFFVVRTRILTKLRGSNY